MAVLLLVIALPEAVLADELTESVQNDLAALGYDPGSISGEMTTDTTVAIARFQADRDMPVTGDVSPLLAGILSSEVDKQRDGGAAAAAASAPAAAPARDPAALQAAQQACLQERVEAARNAQKKKRGFGRLLSAVTRSAGMAGNSDLARTTRDVYSASATAEDLAAAARDLGLTEDEIAACQDP